MTKPAQTKKSPAKKKALPAYVSSMAALGAVLSPAISLPTLKRLMKRPGCPGRLQNGSYAVGAWQAWVKSLDLNEFSDGSGDTPKAEQVRLKNELLKLQLQQLRGDLVSRGEVLDVLSGIVIDVANKLNLMGDAASAKVFGAESVGACKKIIAEEVRKALQAAANLTPSDPDVKKKAGWTLLSAAWSSRLPTLLPGNGPNASS